MRMGAKLGQAVTRGRGEEELRPLCEGSGVVEVVVYSWQLTNRKRVLRELTNQRTMFTWSGPTSWCSPAPRRSGCPGTSAPEQRSPCPAENKTHLVAANLLDI